MKLQLQIVTVKNQNKLLKIRALPEQLKYSAHGEFFLGYLDHSDKTVYLIIVDSEPVGCFYLTADLGGLEPFISANKPQHLLGFTIDYRHQGKGIGKLAMQTLINDLQKTDHDALVLSVNCKNPPAIKLYEKVGFEKKPEHYLGGKSGPQWVMACDLATPAPHS